MTEGSARRKSYAERHRVYSLQLDQVTRFSSNKESHPAATSGGKPYHRLWPSTDSSLPLKGH